MNALRLWLSLGLIGTACAADPKPATQRLGIRFEPLASPPPTSVVFNPAPPPGVIELPRFEVNDAPKKIEPDELLSARGRIAAAQKQFISPLYAKTFGPAAQLAEYYLNFLSLLGGWHPNEKEALVLYDQDQRLKQIKRFDSLLDLTRISSPKEAAELQGLRNESFRRFQPPSGGRGGSSHP